LVIFVHTSWVQYNNFIMCTMCIDEISLVIPTPQAFIISMFWETLDYTFLVILKYVVNCYTV
jgi:hypothetical protein